ncbi:conserved protein of unknown function [uncultured Sphingopyxis sp.]|uniref:Protein SirB1 N-terminal domain-containing protein n=1 Tax=uncultured Sphingopyxis sp. TaxID=310581 RepID=A0A1Y5PQV0_9SPHN|nr:transglutaminase-like domain-containing protein [uncultured Sphingopyxis sp.]SBV32340.1 conserved protein of unknown function [uncultured Sphingopyxis sp.]
MDITAIGLIEDEDILLDLGALALSHLDHASADMAPYLAMLEAIEDRLCRAGRSALLSGERAAILSRVLHGEFGFAGDAGAYDAPVNADFIRVLERRRGLPIALAILYVAMARRAGWSAYILDLPGHVLVEVGEKNPVVIDPFAGGDRVPEAQIAAIREACLGKAGGAAAPGIPRLSNRDALARLLNNQAVRAENGSDLQRALAVYRRITRVAPGAVDAWHGLARLQLAFGDVAGARASLFAMSEVAPDETRRRHILEAFASLDPTGPVAP